MTAASTPVADAIAFTQAWTSHDLASAARYVADDVVFDSPMGHVTTARNYLEGITNLSKDVKSAKIEAAFGEDNRVLIMYVLHTSIFGELRCAKLLTFREGRIISDKLAFDSHPLRKAQSH